MGSPNQPEPDLIVTPTLDDEKLGAKLAVDAYAEQVRLKYINAGSGQALIYQKKAEEAAAYVDAGYPVDLSSYPFIEAEIDATGKTKEQVADDIITARDTWTTIGIQIEKTRLGGKKNIDDATSRTEVVSARNDTITALEAL